MGFLGGGTIISYGTVCFVFWLRAAAHPCESEVQSDCPERASSELARQTANIIAREIASNSFPMPAVDNCFAILPK
eukprot:g12313.t1